MEICHDVHGLEVRCVDAMTQSLLHARSPQYRVINTGRGILYDTYMYSVEEHAAAV